jgi:hypothetical protein
VSEDLESYVIALWYIVYGKCTPLES